MNPVPAADTPAAPTVDLVVRARLGDETAWRELVARYEGPLRRSIRGRLPRAARGLTDTDDMVQDATLNILRRLPLIELRFPGALLAYLRRSVSNRVADEHRRVSRQGPTASLDEELPDRQQSPLDLTLDKDKVRVYRAALLTLPADDRIAIVMRLERGASYEAIAGRLGKPTPNAARVAVARAMFKLAKAMGPMTGPTEAMPAVATLDVEPEPPLAMAAGRRPKR